MAFAVIETGGKQYKVAPGSVVTLEKLLASEGDTFTFDKVLMYQTTADPIIGAPYVEGVTVTATILSQHRGPKIRISTYKAKKRQQKNMGHRQSETRVRISEIVPSKPAAKKETKA